MKSLPVFHLAFPVRDVPEAVAFYRDRLGFPVDLIEDKRCIVNFLGHQAVAHLAGAEHFPKKVEMYPRHFGVLFSDEKEFDAFHERALRSGAEFFQKLFTRFDGTPRAHKTFFLKDPSGNLLEFKWYRDPSLIHRAVERL